MAKKKREWGWCWIGFDRSRESFVWRITIPRSYSIECCRYHRFVGFGQCEASMLRFIKRLGLNPSFDRDRLKQYAVGEASENYAAKLAAKRQTN